MSPVVAAAPVMPADRDELRLILADELSRMLKMDVEGIDLSRSLDEYGLDSIDAIIAAGAVSDRIGFDLPPELLIQHRNFSTIEAAIWALCRPSTPTAAMPAPVFLFSGSAGRDGFLRRLADECGEAAAFETIALGGWREWVREGASLDTLVHRACAQVLASPSPGGIRLAGYSQGGQIAYAVARELVARGHEVRSLYIFDYPAEPFAIRVTHRSVLRWGGRVLGAGLAHAGRLQAVWPTAAAARPTRAGEGRTRARFMARVLDALPPSLARRVMQRASRSPDPLEGGRKDVRIDNVLHAQYFAMLWKTWWIAKRGSLAPLVVDSWLFRSQDEGSEDLGWRKYLGEVRIVRVSGTHASMFDLTNLPVLSAAFTVALAGPSA